jgi:hypothetical protein
LDATLVAEEAAAASRPAPSAIRRPVAINSALSIAKLLDQMRDQRRQPATARRA